MLSLRPRDLLSDAVLQRLGGTHQADPPTVARDIAVLAEAGYLSVTLPASLGGLDCTLRQAACGQRRLAGRAPATALAVGAHLYWTGAAADACRSGDHSVEWIIREAARGALFGAGHGAPGEDLTFASPHSRCERDRGEGYRFRSAGVLETVTPGWDWLAVHALAECADGPGPWPRHEAVLAFAGRGTIRRVARVLAAGAPSDVFTSSAIGWGCALLASVELAAARRDFRQALDGGSAPAQLQWSVAEAAWRVDAMKERIAAVTHPWPRVRQELPDLSGQHVISLFAMRNEVADGSRRVRELSRHIAAARDRAPAQLR